MKISAYIRGLLLPLVAATLFITACACGNKAEEPSVAGTLSVNPTSLSLADASTTATITVNA